MVARHWLYFGGFVVSGLLLVGAALMGLFEGLSALAGGVPATETGLLVTVLGAAAEWIVIGLGLAAIAGLFLAATVVSVLRSASIPRDDRLVSVVERLERHYPVLRRFDVSERVEPTTEDRKRELRERYVAGEIDDDELERKLERLMDDSADGSESASDGTRTLDRSGRSR